MFGLDIAVAGLLQLASMDVSCRVKAAPKVLVQPMRSVVQYDYSKYKEELQTFEIDTVSPYGPGHDAKIGGLMSGEIRVESRVRMMHEKYAHAGKGCVHIDTIDVIVHVNPTIYVAREFKKGTCEHKAIVEHEKKHVKVDADVAAKYAAIIREQLKAKLIEIGSTFGPVPLSKLDDVQKRVQAELDKVVTSNTDQMTAERRELQQSIDTAEEYRRVSNQCP